MLMKKKVEGLVKKNPWGDWDDVNKGWHIDGIHIEDIISSFRDKKVKLVIEEGEVNTYEDLTTEELIKQIRSHNQIQIYTVYEDWCVQLFELSICPNDIDVSCNWEGSDKDLKKVLIRALEHSVED